MFDRAYAPFVLAATVLMTSQPLLTTLSKENGHYQYVQISVTLLAELVKLALSAIFYAQLPRSQRSHRLLTVGHLAQFAAPAAIYFVNNNLIFVILAYVNSTTYQILSSLKTVFTGILFRVMLKRQVCEHKRELFSTPKAQTRRPLRASCLAPRSSRTCRCSPSCCSAAAQPRHRLAHRHVNPPTQPAPPPSASHAPSSRASSRPLAASIASGS